MVQNLLLEIWGMTAEMAPYLLLGFLLAGLMHEFIPRQVYANYLSRPNFKSVFLAALFGVPLPLCSCGVLPTAMGLRREGGSRGATISFLIATPQTGVDSIIATYSMMGLPFAIIRPIVAFLTALFGGTLINRFTPNPSLVEKGTDTTACSGECSKTNDNTPRPSRKGLREGLVGALHYGFVEMMADIGKWLIVGLIVAGMITALVPDQWFAAFKDNSLLSILLVLAISVPMYVCATGSIPIAVALMAKGLTPGAALVLLMAGPACNVASLLVINKVLGRRTLQLYLTAIVSGAVFFAFGIDYLLPREWFLTNIISQGACCADESLGWFSTVSAILLAILLINAFFHHHHHDEACETGLHNESNVQVFNVSGMNCSHCAANVERAIRSIEGVEEVSVSLNEGKAHVSGNVSPDAVKSAVESIGFTVE